MRMKILWTFTILATISSTFAHYVHYHENPQDNAILIQEAGKFEKGACFLILRRGFVTRL